MPSKKNAVGIMVPKVPTANQSKIVYLLSEGFTTVQIADEMGVSARTIEAHLDRIRAEFGALSRPHLVKIFLVNNIIQ